MSSEITFCLYPKMLGCESSIEQLSYGKHMYCCINSSYCIVNYYKFQTERYILNVIFYKFLY